MNDSIKSKIISSVLLVLSFAMLFVGWIRFDESQMIREVFNDEFDEYMDEIEDEVEEYDDILDELHVGITSKQIIRAMRDMISILENGTIAPAKVATKSKGFLKLCKKIDKLSSSKKEDLPYDLRYLTRDIEEFIAIFKVHRVFMAITFIIFAAYIALHILNKRNLGIPPILIMIVAWTTYGLFCSVTDGELNLTIAPFLSVVLAIAAAIVWGKGRPAKVAPNVNPNAFVPRNNAPVNVARPAANNASVDRPSASGNTFCPYCGTQVSAGAAFCPSCGAKLN